MLNLLITRSAAEQKLPEPGLGAARAPPEPALRRDVLRELLKRWLLPWRRVLRAGLRLDVGEDVGRLRWLRECARSRDRGR